MLHATISGIPFASGIGEQSPTAADLVTVFEAGNGQSGAHRRLIYKRGDDIQGALDLDAGRCGPLGFNKFKKRLRSLFTAKLMKERFYKTLIRGGVEHDHDGDV